VEYITLENVTDLYIWTISNATFGSVKVVLAFFFLLLMDPPIHAPLKRAVDHGLLIYFPARPHHQILGPNYLMLGFDLSLTLPIKTHMWFATSTKISIDQFESTIELILAHLCL
jgi:hypothetical protein